MLDTLRAEAGFTLLYPCELPAGEALVSAAAAGEGQRRHTTMVFAGPFDLTLGQALAPPAVSPDPTGASRIYIPLYPDVRAILIERNDGSQRAFYQLLWERDGVYFEIVADGPPQSRRLILEIARSLE